MSNSTIDQYFIDQVKLLLECAKAGKEEEVNDLLDELSASRGTMVYQQLGKLTRDFHDALGEFSSDSRLAELANTEFGDARERLHFVISKTQQAADLTMTQVENSIPLCDSLIQITQELSLSWDKLTSKEMKAEEFRKLSKKIKVFLQTANNDGETLKANLNEVLLTQDFQDITGQVIYKVIKLVEDIENNLISLIKLASQHINVNEDSEKDKKLEQNKSSLDGPVVPGITNMSETVSGQDEVDDLLSSLGF
ncbi:MAG: protein phosphatase CheZ [Pseudomonadota bacterium]